MKKGFVIFTAILIGIFSETVSYAQMAGKINGVVRDREGNVLPGVNVVIQGTRRGVTTDAEGYYLLLSIEPGVYSLAASMVGYVSTTKTNVLVQTGQTTTVNFALQEATIEIGEMVVTAERPPVEPDKTSSKYTVTSEDINNLTIARSPTDLIALQPGVSQDGLFRIRGGDVGTENAGFQYRPTDVAMVVDGVRIQSNDGRLNPMFTGVNRGAVQEITLITGVTAAEYGNAQAGIINIVTRDGGQEYHGWLEYRNIPASKKHSGENVYDAPIHRNFMKWGDAAWEQETDPVTGRRVHERVDYTGVTGHEFEANLSGPLKKNVSFVISGQHSRQASPLPGPEKYGFYRGNTFIPAPGNFQGSGAVTWRLSSGIKIKAGMFYQGYKSWYNGVAAGGTRGMGNDGRNLFLPEKYSSSGQHRFREDMEYIAFTHILTPKTFYEVRLSRSRSLQDTLHAATETTALRQDAGRRYNLGLSSANWEMFDRMRYTLKADLSSQVSKGHFFKTGGEFIAYQSWLTAREDVAVGNTIISYFGGNRKMGEPVRPVQGALYVQDKMEFEGLVVNAGLRMDYFNARTQWPAMSVLFARPDTRFFTTQDNAPMGPVKSQKNLSPRLGVSHPITDRAAMRFSSGMFLQYPGFDAYYLQAYHSNNQPHSLDLNNNKQIDPAEVWNNMIVRAEWWGDPNIRPEKSLSFEVGGDWNFVSNYTLSLTTFYRAEWDQLGGPQTSWVDPVLGGTMNQRANLRAEDVRGMELSLHKAFGNHFAFQVAYNLQWSEITHVSGRGSTQRRIVPDSLYIAGGNWTWDWTIDPATGARIPKALTEADIKLYGGRANAQMRTFIRQVTNREPSNIGPVSGFWDLGYQFEGPEGEKGLYFFGASQLRGIHTWGAKPADRRNSGKVQVTVNTPQSTSSGSMGWLYSNLNLNVLYRVQNGATYSYLPPTGGKEQWRSGPLESRFDVQAQKTISLGKDREIAVFATVLNVFNEQSIARIDSSVDWVQWGLETARPNNPEFISYGDLNDFARFTNKPRHVELGLRMRF